jgi:hypothetical protein
VGTFFLYQRGLVPTACCTEVEILKEKRLQFGHNGGCIGSKEFEKGRERERHVVRVGV